MNKLDPIIQKQDLLERLESIKKRVGDMCLNHHGPRMSIPTNSNDDDLFIHVTIDDTIRFIEDYYINERAKLISLKSDFAHEIYEKLIQKLNQGKRGWDNKENKIYMMDQLEKQLEEGNYLNVAIYCMFLWGLNNETN